MLKLLTRRFFAVFVPLLFLAAPSALAAHGSHRATFRAHHRHGGKRNVRHKVHHGQRKGRHGRKTVRLVASTNTASVAPGALLGESIVESHSDYVYAGEAEAFRVQATAS